jgi:CheY-like chemotaxis protein
VAACILVIDDDAGIRQAMELLLKKAGYDVTFASDGTGARPRSKGRPS